MTELSAAKLADLREIAESASPGPWSQWNPAMGPSHIAIGGKVAFESLQSATRFADDEVISHWCDATHIAAFDPPTVLALLDRIEEQAADFETLRQLHRPVEIEPSGTICGECSMRLPNGKYFGRLEEWPCPTLQVIEESDD